MVDYGDLHVYKYSSNICYIYTLERLGFPLLGTTQEKTIKQVSFETKDSFNAFGRLPRIY